MFIFSFVKSVQQIPTDIETVCKDPTSPFFRLLNFRDGDSSFPNSFLFDFVSLVYGKSYYDKEKFILDNWMYEDVEYDLCWKLFQRGGALISVEMGSAFYTEISKSRKWSQEAMFGIVGR